MAEINYRRLDGNAGQVEQSIEYMFTNYEWSHDALIGVIGRLVEKLVSDDLISPVDALEITGLSRDWVVTNPPKAALDIVAKVERG